jgi:hypothetical protein
MVIPGQRPPQQPILLVAETDAGASLRPLLCCRRLATIDWEWYPQIPLKPGWFWRSRPPPSGTEPAVRMRVTGPTAGGR